MNFIYSIISLSARMLPLLVILIFLNTTSSTVYIAEFLYVISFASIASTLIEFGHTNSVPVNFSKFHNKINLYALKAKLLNTVFYVLIIIILVYIFDFQDINLLVNIAIYFAIFHLQNHFLIMIRLQESFRCEAKISILSNLLFLLTFLVSNFFVSVEISLVLARILSLIFFMKYIKRLKYIFRIDFHGSDDQTKLFYQVSFSYWLLQCFGHILLNIDMILLKPILELSDYKEYSMILRFYIPLTMISVAITPVILYINTRRNQNKGWWPDLLKLITMVSIIFILIYFLFDEFLILVIPSSNQFIEDYHGLLVAVIGIRIIALFVNAFLFTKSEMLIKLIPSLAAVTFYLCFVNTIDNVDNALNVLFQMYLIFALVGFCLLFRGKELGAKIG